MSRASRLTVAVCIVALGLFGPVGMKTAGSAVANSRYVVHAWSDLGTHALNPARDKASVTPRYDNLVAQVFLRGNPPRVVTSGLVVEYRISCNAYSLGKEEPGRFWTFVRKQFGKILSMGKVLDLVDTKEQKWPDGRMAVDGKDFVADGIPIPPADEMDIWNPYHVAAIMVKNKSGKVLAQTSTAIPASGEISCGKCHGVDPFKDIMQRHDRLHGTDLADKAPMLCSGCHEAPGSV